MVINRNELLAVVIEGKLREGQDEKAALTDLLPAGWLIEAADLRPDLAIAPEARTQLQLDSDDKGTVLRREAQDDRFVVLLDLGRAREGFRLGFLVRAAYPGVFAWPGTTVAGLRHPALAGHTASTRVSIGPGG